jgi:uncharacterized protein (UPF0335 family)
MRAKTEETAIHAYSRNLTQLREKFDRVKRLLNEHGDVRPSIRDVCSRCGTVGRTT